MAVVSTRFADGMRDVLADTRQAFDRVAAGYHDANVQNPVLQAMRRRVVAALTRQLPPGSRVLDLGCGPGTDAVVLAHAGYAVTAVDWSPAMVAEARRRVRAAAVDDRVDVRHMGIHELDLLAPATFDAAYSNFGPLNCVPDLSATAAAVSARLGPGGVLVASIIGRWCPWELGLFAAKGQWTRALVRFSRAPVPVPLDGATVWTAYLTPAEFVRAFSTAGFARVSLRALGAFVPPPYMQAFARRRPRLVSCLQRIEDLVGGWPGVRACGDHFLVVLRKR